MDLDEILAQAATRRAEQTVARADRPSQRRCAEVAGSGAYVDVRAKPSIREADGGSGLLHFEGYGTVYEAGYEMWDWAGPYTEIVSAGAGEQTLPRTALHVHLVLPPASQ